MSCELGNFRGARCDASACVSAPFVRFAGNWDHCGGRKDGQLCPASCAGGYAPTSPYLACDRGTFLAPACAPEKTKKTTEENKMRKKHEISIPRAGVRAGEN